MRVAPASDEADSDEASDEAELPPATLSSCCSFTECEDLFELLFCEETCGLCVPITMILLVIGYALITSVFSQETAAAMPEHSAPARRFHSSPLTEPVDLVFLWVNGSDPRHRQNLQSALERKLLPYTPHSSRFRDEGIFECAHGLAEPWPVSSQLPSSPPPRLLCMPGTRCAPRWVPLRSCLSCATCTSSPLVRCPPGSLRPWACLQARCLRQHP